MANILVVEDDTAIRDVLRRYLERAGHRVMTTGTGSGAIQILSSSAIDLVLLDLGLPDIDGTEVLVEARTQGPAVIVLTARQTLDDRITGFELGADDYVAKPFSPREVVLRVGAVLGRTHPVQDDAPMAFAQGRLVIEPGFRRVTCDGHVADTTPTEWGLLTALAAAPGRPFSRFELINKIRGYEFAGYERVIDSHVKNLRRKLGPAGAEVIVTALGVGYKFGWSRDLG